VGKPTLDPQTAINILRRQLAVPIESMPFDGPGVEKWWNLTERIVEEAFGAHHRNFGQFVFSVSHGSATREQQQQYHIETVRGKKALLQSFIEQLELLAVPGHRSLPGENQMIVRTNDEGRIGVSAGGSRKVFVVYGQDKTARTQLEAMLRRWDLQPLILDQLPSSGMTVVEKVIQYSHDDVGFAVVLATPDDEGNRRGATKEKKSRARQNVVLELGLVLAKLGRPRVAILLKDAPNMEKPSDIDGLIYLPFEKDVEEIKVKLAQEMTDQGLLIPVQKL